MGSAANLPAFWVTVVVEHYWELWLDCGISLIGCRVSLRNCQIHGRELTGLRLAGSVAQCDPESNVLRCKVSLRYNTALSDHCCTEYTSDVQTMKHCWMRNGYWIYTVINITSSSVTTSYMGTFLSCGWLGGVCAWRHTLWWEVGVAGWAQSLHGICRQRCWRAVVVVGQAAGCSGWCVDCGLSSLYY